MIEILLSRGSLERIVLTPVNPARALIFINKLDSARFLHTAQIERIQVPTTKTKQNYYQKGNYRQKHSRCAILYFKKGSTIPVALFCWAAARCWVNDTIKNMYALNDNNNNTVCHGWQSIQPFRALPLCIKIRITLNLAIAMAQCISKKNELYPVKIAALCSRTFYINQHTV